MNATYTKLRDGNWGIKIVGAGEELGAAKLEGKVVTVRKASGEVKQETVAKVIYSQPTYVLCTLARAGTRSAHSYAGRPSSSGGGRCRECRGPLVSVPEHRAMGGLCGSCAFDEYDC